MIDINWLVVGKTAMMTVGIGVTILLIFELTRIFIGKVSDRFKK